MCIRVVLYQQKNGLPALLPRSMNSMAAARVSSSIVSIRFLCERAGVFDRLRRRRGGSDHPSVAKFLPEFRILGIVLVFGFLLGVQVIEVAEELVEAVHVGRNSLLSPRWFLPNWPVT